jgi:two-component system OmpR family sensor kinase
MSIRLRVALGFTVLFCLAMALLGGGLYAVLRSTLGDEVDKALRDRADQLARASLLRGDTSLDARNLSADIFVLTPGAAQELASPGIFARVLNTDGKTLAVSSGVAAGLPIDTGSVQQATAGRSTYRTITVDGTRVRVYYTPLYVGSSVRAVVQVGESLHPVDHTLAGARRLLLIGGLIALAASLAGGWWVTRQALRPVDALTDAVARISSTGEFGQRVPQPATNDEVGRLAATFNALLARLTLLFDRQRTLVADTSHELRNPLMVVRGNLELLAHGPPPEQRREAVKDAIEEVDRMTRLIADLLFLADADTDQSIARERVALDAIVTDVAGDARRLAVREDGERVFVLDQNDPVFVQGDAERLRQLISNLVENAMRYTPPGGTIRLALRRHGPVAELTVADTGIGIAEEHQEHIFERFYRVDRGRSRALGGTGLGLSIVRQVAAAHGGTVRLRSSPGAGSIFTVVVPVAQEPAAD